MDDRAIFHLTDTEAKSTEFQESFYRLHNEFRINEHLLNLHKIAASKDDAQFCDYLEGDFLKDYIFKKIVREFKKYKKKVIVFSNLPYKTAIPILAKIFRNRSYFQKLILMFQKEQAERIMAKKNTKAYGRISVISNWLCDIKKRMNLSPNYFFPKPKIDSSILEFKFKKKIMKVDNEDLLLNVIKLCFNQRRKTIKNNLKIKINFSDKMFLNCEIDSKKRPEELDFIDFINLSNFLSKNKKEL